MLGFVSDREFFRGGFSPREEADGKAATQCCAPPPTEASEASVSQADPVGEVVPASRTEYPQRMSVVLWMKTRVPQAGWCLVPSACQRAHCAFSIFLPQMPWVERFSPLGLPLPPDPLSPLLKSLPQGGLLGLAVIQSKPAWFALSQKCASLSSINSLLNAGNICCQVLRFTKDFCSWVLKYLGKDLDCLCWPGKLFPQGMCLKGLALQRSESLLRRLSYGIASLVTQWSAREGCRFDGG